LIYLPDTNVCVAVLRNAQSAIAQKMNTVRREDILLCDIVKAELFYGAYRSAQPLANIAKVQAFLAPFRSAPFDEASALIFGRIRRELETVGTPIGPYDLQIAAVTLAHNAVLVTHNTREFRRVNGLILEDWEV